MRDQARKLSKTLGFENEFKILNNIIGALLRTQESKLEAPNAIARAAGKPYDPDRIELFTILCEALIKNILPKSHYPHKEPSWNNNLAFFEAYFSNYIEGTEFTVEEAKEIVFEQKIIRHRSVDSHDILGTYQIVSNLMEMTKAPTDAFKEPNEGKLIF